MGAIKHDEDKLRMDLLSPDALMSTAAVLTFGAKKYAARNWEIGISYSRVYAALQRHLHAWWNGEENDPETGMNHLHHAACCLHFLQHYVNRPNRYRQNDDRPLYEVPVENE